MNHDSFYFCPNESSAETRELEKKNKLLLTKAYSSFPPISPCRGLSKREADSSCLKFFCLQALRAQTHPCLWLPWKRIPASATYMEYHLFFHFLSRLV
ncbi:hypothetical protein NPIL_502871 [Nephila pilipes]|uniref:Uncharacterized protein n=1 Tax=Nephila pilipes TaxID=299642 RepID=A0A8X6Q2T6_NEPPI|nr:hypothetical protein NPIL_502871 [Nephila pilipes]